MSIMLATLCLNEIEWIPYLYDQHRHWPDLIKWVFVESADRAYAEANPDMVTDKGLSVDGTSQYLQHLTTIDPKVVYIPYGFSQHRNKDQGKCESRQQYLDIANQIKPTFIMVVDADEFYTRKAQKEVTRLLYGTRPRWKGMLFKQRHIWHPQVISQEPLFSREVVGGFWDIPHCRGWRWLPGMRYQDNHNSPQVDSYIFDRRMLRFDTQGGTPECIHMGFASQANSRSAKNRYYQHRGEGVTDFRGWYIQSRACYETWHPEENPRLPRGARVIKYEGDIPECFNRIITHGCSLPVLDPAYWKQRLEDAKNDYHLAVFNGNQKLWHKVIEQQREELARVIQPEDKILDAGCGWGRLLDILPKHWKGKYVGVDISPEFIQQARRLYPQATFEVGDLRKLTDLPVVREMAPFDWVVLAGVKTMIIRNVGMKVWEEIESELRKVASCFLYLTFGEHD